MPIAPHLPFFDQLETAQNILIAGAGGGFDIFTGLPLYFMLQAAGKTVHLANLSFSTIFATNGRVLAPALVEITAKTEANLRYFPELHLAQWFRKDQNADVPIYCIDRVGTRPITEAYQFLAQHLHLDAIVLVDGGTDSLMRGDENGLGTPEEDSASLAAVSSLDAVPIKLLACLGFGIDTFHGVCHAQFLEAVAALGQTGGYLGTWSLLGETPEAQAYERAVNAVHEVMWNHPSIVNASIVSALQGHFGNYHAHFRTQGSELFINPLMSLYWAFSIEAVASRCLYLDKIRHTETHFEQAQAIDAFRRSLPAIREWTNLPV